MELSSTSSPPTYRIFRDGHGIPQFSPKRGTQALKDALIYAFPTLETELQLMQAALRKFFDAERGSKFVSELRQNDLQTSLSKTKDTEVSPIQIGKASLKSWKLPMGPRRGSRASSRASSRPPSRPPSRAMSRVSSRAETPITRPDTPDGNGGKMTTWVLSSGQELEGRRKMPYDPVKRRKVAENRGNVCDKHRASKTMCDPELCPDNKAYSRVAELAKDAIDLSSFSSLPTVEEIKKSQMGKDHHSSGQHAISKIVQSANAEVFWESSEHPNFSEHSDLSFEDSETPSWTDISLTNSHSTASWTTDADVLPGANTPSNLEGETTHELDDLATFSYRDQHLPFPLNGGIPDFPAPLLDSPMQLQQLLGDPTAGYTEDPFMGWTSKRTSQICEDYGWVLSHVGSL